MPYNYKKSLLDRLIPTAMREAEEIVAYTGIKYMDRYGRDGRPYRMCMRTLYFHRAMNRMAHAEGLRVL